MTGPDPTARTRDGCVDLEPFLRRDETRDYTIPVRTWERRPAALALLGRGWTAERVSRAAGLNIETIHALENAGAD